MYKNKTKTKTILGLIPARGGSKGIPHKNIIDLCGKPLIGYTIEAGKGSKYIDYLMVSTDDATIADVARTWGGCDVPFMRPSYLADDTSKTIDVVIHAIQMLRASGKTFDTLVLLQPTQPLRTSEDIDGAIEDYMNSDCISLASVNLVDDHPLLIRTISERNISQITTQPTQPTQPTNGNSQTDKTGNIALTNQIDNDQVNDRIVKADKTVKTVKTVKTLKPMLNASSTCRRQDMPVYYRVNGCIYINEIDSIDENTSFNDNSLPFIMDNSHSVDIDDYKDLCVAEFFLKEKKKRE